MYRCVGNFVGPAPCTFHLVTLFASDQFELRTAIELRKQIILVHETEGAHGRFDFTSEKAAAPDDLRRVLDGE